MYNTHRIYNVDWAKHGAIWFEISSMIWNHNTELKCYTLHTFPIVLFIQIQDFRRKKYFKDPVPSWFVKQVVPSLIFHLLLMTSNELILWSNEFTPHWTTNMWGLFWAYSLMVMVTPLKELIFADRGNPQLPFFLI